jgi:O-antigen/teichoic acid export membrane protein
MARGPEGPNSAAFERALRYLLVIQGALAAPLLVWPEPITEIALGSGYEESVDVLRALAPFAVLVGISPLLARAVNYMGEAAKRVPIVVGALVVDVGIDLALLSKIGVVAAAIATDVAYTLYVIGHLWLCYRLVNLQLRPLAVTLMRTLLAAGAMALVLLAFGTSDVPIPLVVLGGALGLLVYGAVLVLTREIELATLMQARRRLWAALPRPAR